MKTQLENGTEGGPAETHQTATEGAEVLTTSQGVPVADNQNSLTAGVRGPTLLEDFILRDKIFHFDHERIPERVVHARGFGAHGTFECTRDLSDITRAAPFQKVGKLTETFVRFSTVAGNKGSFDLARDVRGFAVKFYTDEGNWDLVGNNIPVFFIQDAIKFPDLVHAVKPAPDRGFPQAQSAHDNFWDYISLTPESMHMIMWQMSDRTIPRSFRTMEGFGVHTFRLVNSEGASTFVKFHWKPRQGLQSVVWDEAVKINGADPDHHRRDLWEALTTGDHPQWDLCLQLFDQDFADSFDFDVLDPTKIIPEELVPAEPVGTLTLDRAVDNFFEFTEQVAFCTQHVIPGIDFTEDPLLQGRNFSYLDTQLKRLGSPNFSKLEVNRPRGCPMSNFQQDGHMRVGNRRGRVNYEPNGFEEGPREDPLAGYVSFRAPVEGTKIRLRPESFADHYSQARQFYISQTPVEQDHIRSALAFELGRCELARVRRAIVGHLRNIDEGLAEGVAHGLGMPELPPPATAARPTRQDLPPSDALSILKNGPMSFQGRVMGVLIADGFDGTLLDRLTGAVTEAGGKVKLIAPRIYGATDDRGELREAQFPVSGGPSVLFDAVAVLIGPEGEAKVAMMPEAQNFLRDAFAHGKFIGHALAGELFRTAGLEGKADDGCFDLGLVDDGETVDSFVTSCARLRHWTREGLAKPAP
ncbi:MAG TPA: catalase [Tabrizicola sp.]|nr:catalase [Tabrizicola sp.]